MGYENALALTRDERQLLADSEGRIERGLKTFVEVGNALTDIRDNRLYRETHGTFEDYCRERWAISQPRAYQYIEAAAAVKQISTIVEVLPANEAQARPLTRLEPEQQVVAWQEAVATSPNGKVTAAYVQSVVDRMLEPDDEPDPVVLAAIVEPYEIAVPAQPEPANEPVAVPNKMAVHHSSETPEHYTPDEVIEAVIDCLGEIDLDPCADPGRRVTAGMHYTAADDGLSRAWYGRVYMNPPYGRGIIEWVSRLVEQYESGNVTEAIALLPARPDTQWWRTLRNYPVCFVEGRLTFIGNDDPAPFPSALFYLGPDIDRFYRHFAGFGDIWQRIEPGMFGE